MNCSPGKYLSMDQLAQRNCVQANNPTAPLKQDSPTITCSSSMYPTVDDDGNRICKSADRGAPQYYSYPTNSATHGTGTPASCPIGTFPVGIGIFGNQICRRV